MWEVSEIERSVTIVSPKLRVGLCGVSKSRIPLMFWASLSSITVNYPHIPKHFDEVPNALSDALCVCVTPVPKGSDVSKQGAGARWGVSGQ